MDPGGWGTPLKSDLVYWGPGGGAGSPGVLVLLEL